MLRRAVELGVDFIDTLDSYGRFVSEQLITEALHPYPADLVIATKVGLTRHGPHIWKPVGRPEYPRQQAELSLRPATRPLNVARAVVRAGKGISRRMRPRRGARRGVPPAGGTPRHDHERVAIR